MFNMPLEAAMWGVFVAQWIKVPILYFKTGNWDWKIGLSTGSMPSSHTAFVIALTTSIGFKEGVGTSIFALSAVFSLITLHDAVKVRGESGKQAKVLNDMKRDLQSVYQILNVNKQENREAKLKELIGHTTNEVLGGIIVGLLVAIFYFYLNNVL